MKNQDQTIPELTNQKLYCTNDDKGANSALPILIQNEPNPWVIVRVIEQNRYVVGRFPNQPEAQTQLWFLKRKLPRSRFEVVDERG